MQVGSEHTPLVILRGNSASGKTAVAQGIRSRFGRGIAIIGQDVIRRDILKERDLPAGANIGLIDLTARYALDYGFHVIVEGILDAGRYGAMLRKLIADHLGASRVYYFDVSFEVTLERHATKPQAAEYGAPEMRQRFRPLVLLDIPDLPDSIIPESASLERTISLVMHEAGFPVVDVAAGK